MFTSSQFPQIPLSEVFRLLSAGATLITPNRRLASTFKNSFDSNQARHELTAWQSADILPISAFIKRIYQEIFYADHVRLPILLTPVQEQVLWEVIIRDSEIGQTLLTVPQTAQWVREAWQLAHAWQLFPQLKQFPLNEDSMVFHSWCERFRHLTQQAQQIDEIRLYDLLTALLDQQLNSEEPIHIICYGFDVLTPQQRTFLDRFVATGCPVSQYTQSTAEASSSNQGVLCQHVGRVVFNNTAEEVYQAAIWARARIESNHAARIGVVVPELSKHRAAITRIFHKVMLPDVASAFPDSAQYPVPFNISLGQLLINYPLVDTAFIILELICRDISFSRVSRLLHSPFLSGGETELSHRVQFDAQLRQHVGPAITLNQLVSLIHSDIVAIDCPILVQCLFSLTTFQAQLAHQNCHATLAVIIAEILVTVGFPGERTLNSTEYQTLKKWQNMLAEFATLDQVQSGCTFSEAIACLYRMAANTLFQPETPDVPIQILGVLEAAGLTFDHLWVVGLSDEVWPLRARINPFLPVPLQRQAGLPLGSTLAANVYSKQLTMGWLANAREVILSHPAFSDERDGHALQPSPLIKQIETVHLTLPTFISHQDEIIRQSTLESYLDDQDSLMHDTAGITGGISIIKDYAACPFRAWVKHRLGVSGLRSPHAGLDAMERGSLIHDVLARLWMQLKTKNTLDHINEDELDKILQQAADHAVKQMQDNRPAALSGQFAVIERQRLIHLARQWLNMEKQRSFFSVVAVEEKRSVNIAGLLLGVRLDRIDVLENGERIIIDYKTSQLSTRAMLGERPDEPQLPLYLVMAEPGAIAVAFAQIKPGAMKFEAIARDAGIFPGVKAFSASSLKDEYSDWDALINSWQTDLTTLANGFLNGDAQVFPKNYPETCRYCDIKPFCRIHERINVTPVATV